MFVLFCLFFCSLFVFFFFSFPEIGVSDPSWREAARFVIFYFICYFSSLGQLVVCPLH